MGEGDGGVGVGKGVAVGIEVGEGVVRRVGEDVTRRIGKMMLEVGEAVGVAVGDAGVGVSVDEKFLLPGGVPITRKGRGRLF